MELQTILFSFKGRINRGTYWLAIVPVTIAVHLIASAPLFMVSTESEEMPVGFLIAIFIAQVTWLVGLWPLLAVGSKRLHDRDKSGWWLLVFWILPVLLFFGGFGYDFTDRNPVQGAYFSTGLIMMIASLPIALWGLVELGILPGTTGPNGYGAEPARQA